MDLMIACELLQSASTDLKAFLNQFDEAKKQACVIAKKWNIATEFAQKRINIHFFSGSTILQLKYELSRRSSI